MVNANPFHHGSPQAGTRNTRDRSKDQSLSPFQSLVVAQILTIIIRLCRLTLSITVYLYPLSTYHIGLAAFCFAFLPFFPPNLMHHSRDTRPDISAALSSSSAPQLSEFNSHPNCTPTHTKLNL